MYHLVHSALPFILSCPELFVGHSRNSSVTFWVMLDSLRVSGEKKVFRKSVWHGTCLPFLLHAVVVLKKKLDPKNEGGLVHLIRHALYSLIG